MNAVDIADAAAVGGPFVLLGAFYLGFKIWCFMDEGGFKRRQTVRSVRRANRRAVGNLISSAQAYELKRRRLRGDTIDQMRDVVRDHRSAGRDRQSGRS